MLREAVAYGNALYPSCVAPHPRTTHARPARQPTERTLMLIRNATLPDGRHGMDLLVRDGRLDFVTGKRFMAHNGTDPGEREPLGVYWYEVRTLPPAAGLYRSDPSLK